MLRDECGVLTPKWLPYSAVLVPLAAIWGRVTEASGVERGIAREKLRQFFWCTVFTGAYDASPNSAAVRHYQDVGKWLDGGPEPDIVKTLDARFDPELLLDAKIGQRALYRGVVALSARHSALDFHEFQPITKERIEDKKIDAHHVFPKAFLAAQAQATGVSLDELPHDLILNRALIDKSTNRRIKDRPPSDYLAEIENAHTSQGLANVLSSHLLPATKEASGLWTDEYLKFIRERQALIVAELEKVTGKTVKKTAALAAAAGDDDDAAG
jgi:hypothetical protein